MALSVAATTQRHAEASYWTAQHCLALRNWLETSVGHVLLISLVEAKHGCDLVVLDGTAYGLFELLCLLVTPEHGCEVQGSGDWNR